MADPNAPGNPNDDDLPELGEQPYAQEPKEIDEDAPRRAASARFEVDAQIGSEAAMRDAMDPANQSLAEALRLSYRVLQVVIVVLVVLFLASGFKTIDDGQSGVLTVWGDIRTVNGQEALTPGLQFSWAPYPAGEFVVFKVENRSADVGDAFSPNLRGRTRRELVEQAATPSVLTPGQEGTLITHDGDLGHLRVTVAYQIDQPVEFVQRVDDAAARRNADALVRLALQQAAVRAAASMTYAELTNPNLREDLELRIKERAQEALDGLGCGIVITDVTEAQATPPLFIENTAGDPSAAKVAADQAVEDARKKAEETILDMAGIHYEDLLKLISEYEDALEAGQDAGASEVLDQINAMLEGDQVGGQVAGIIQHAKTYQSHIQSTLGNEYQRFASYQPRFRNNPKLLTRQLWLETYAKVVNHPDTEIIYVPKTLVSMNILLTGSEFVREARDQGNIRLRQQMSNRDVDISRPYILRGADMTPGEAYRQLKEKKEGGLGPAGGPL